MTKYIYHNRKRTFEKLPQYIYLRKNGMFEIRKRVGGVLVYWGSFKTLEEAELFKAYFIGKNWETIPKYKANKHIIQRNGKHMILKKIGDKMVSFGTFDELNDARHERDVCVLCGWDYDLIVEYED